MPELHHNEQRSFRHEQMSRSRNARFCFPTWSAKLLGGRHTLISLLGARYPQAGSVGPDIAISPEAAFIPAMNSNSREPSTPQTAPSHGSRGHHFSYFRPLGFSPDVFEAAGRERGVPDRALDRAMTQVRLQRPCVGPLVGQGVSG